jgi:SAM-dependent methyltransferase
VRCEGCGHVYNDPVPEAADLAAFYARDYRRAYKGAEKPRPRQIVRNFERLEDYYRRWRPLLEGRRRMLDVGAGSGEFLFLAQGFGFEARGVEPNAAYAAYCREDLGLNVETTRLDDLPAAGETYDFIRLNHVLEHLRDPVEALARIAGWLAPEGVLYVEVPNVEAYARTKSRGRMFHYGHISNFSPWTLRAAAARAGLEELPECVASQADQTATFFRVGRASSALEARNPENAQRVRAAIEAHYARRRPLLARLRRLGGKLALRARETRAGRELGTPAAIGAHHLERLRRQTPVTPSRT